MMSWVDYSQTSGIIVVDDTTDEFGFDGSLQTDGGLSVAKG